MGDSSFSSKDESPIKTANESPLKTKESPSKEVKDEEPEVKRSDSPIPAISESTLDDILLPLDGLAVIGSALKQEPLEVEDIEMADVNQIATDDDNEQFSSSVYSPVPADDATTTSSSESSVEAEKVKKKSNGAFEVPLKGLLPEDSPSSKQPPAASFAFKVKKKLPKIVFNTSTSADSSQAEDENASNEEEEKRYQCRLCNKAFAWSKHLRAHFNAKHPEAEGDDRNGMVSMMSVVPYISPKTIAELANIPKRKPYAPRGSFNYVRTPEGRYKCPNCTATFAWPRGLRKHQEVVCPPSAATNIVGTNARTTYCTYCDKPFKNAADCKRHEMTHLNKTADEHHRIKCVYCEKTYTTKEGLRYHLLNHHNLSKKQLKDEGGPAFQPTLNDIIDRGLSEQRPYQCTYCWKAFLHDKDRKKHERCHTLTEEDRLQCPQCPATFARRDGWKKHDEKVHGGLAEVDSLEHVCKFCSERFKTRAAVLRHELDHRRSKNLCGECGKSYHTKYDLRMHVAREHVGDLRFKCRYCDERFAVKCDRMMHERKHEKNYDDDDSSNSSTEIDKES